MNPVRVRDTIRSMSNLCLKPEAVREVLDSPIFAFEDDAGLNEQEVKWCRENICTGEGLQVPTKLPYDVLTIHRTMGKGVDREDSTIVVWATPYGFRGPDGVQRTAILTTCSHQVIEGHQIIYSVRYTGLIQSGAVMMFWKDGKQFHPSDEKTAIMKDMAKVSRSIVLRLAFAVMNPGSAVIRVSPSQPGRSVEWRKAREHYLVLPMRQAQAMQKRGSGPTDHDLVRAAHWRRAHFRTLTSDKFKAKRGQQIFIKKSWVGPLEWAGTDGKIYKVMNHGTDKTNPPTV